MDKGGRLLLDNETWVIHLDQEKKSVKLINSLGEELPDEELASLVYYLNNRLYDINEEKYRKNRLTPLDEFTKKRLNIEHYLLLRDEFSGKTRKIFEAYINRFLILDSFDVFNGRMTYDTGYNAVLDVKEAKELLPLLQQFIKDCDE